MRGVTVDRPDQAWAELARGHIMHSMVGWPAEGMDITYVPMARGFVYLAAASTKAGFCVEALARHGAPGIFNTDQGSQFTTVLLKARIAISMDGKGAWRDNVFVERLWLDQIQGDLSISGPTTRSAKPEPRSDAVWPSTTAVGRHSSLDRKTPDQAYFDRPPQTAAA